MDRINAVLTSIFDLLLKFFDRRTPLYGLCFISIVSGWLLLRLFMLASNKASMEKVKNKITAHILGVALYKHDIVLSFKAIGNMLLANLVYIRASLVPLCVVLIPCILIMAQLNLRYGSRPFAVGEETVFKVFLDKSATIYDYSLSVDDGLAIVTPALRIASTGEIDWRIKAVKSGVHTVTLSNIAGQSFTKQFIVDKNESKLANGRYKSWLKNLIYPGELSLQSHSPVNELTINYPEITHQFFSVNLSWLVIFCIVSLGSGLIFKVLLKF